MNPEAAILEAVAAAGATRGVVLIDGGAGAGKSTLAAALVAAWPGVVQLVAMDSFYPGWGGLAAASELVADTVLRPSDPAYRRWDWGRSRPAEWVSLDPRLPLVVEGCGALTPRTRVLADVAVWCELDEAQRHRRALARDGDLFAPHWEQWKAQEAEHWRAHRPWELADVVVSPVSLA